MYIIVKFRSIQRVNTNYSAGLSQGFNFFSKKNLFKIKSTSYNVNKKNQSYQYKLDKNLLINIVPYKNRVARLKQEGESNMASDMRDLGGGFSVVFVG